MRHEDVTDEIDQWRQQIRKGSTRLAVLQLLREKEHYGYELVQTLRARTKGALDLPEGNVYPILHALEKDGAIKATWRDVERGVPARKYYSLTPRGRAIHAGIVRAWREHSDTIDDLLQGGK